MKKPEKNKKKRASEINRGTKRSLRFKASREKVAIKKKKMQELKRAHDIKMNEMVNKILQSRMK